ncbi:MAG: YdbH domain-containing protein, partial [Chromatiales bacterium]|nr:YdbH domain-containing protein [Chromatiales bacterium]
TLSADKSAAGETTLLLSLAGHNPDVLEGYPFKLNIGLETDAAPLLAMFRQGTDLFDEVIKRVWRPGATIR